MKNKEVLERVEKILAEILPSLDGRICVKDTPTKNCSHVGTFENEIPHEDFHFCFCLYFKDESKFVPSIFCNVGKVILENVDPGEVINLDSLEKGVLDFISKTGVKEFLEKNLEYIK